MGSTNTLFGRRDRNSNFNQIALSILVSLWRNEKKNILQACFELMEPAQAFHKKAGAQCWQGKRFALKKGFNQIIPRQPKRLHRDRKHNNMKNATQTENGHRHTEYRSQAIQSEANQILSALCWVIGINTLCTIHVRIQSQSLTIMHSDAIKDVAKSMPRRYKRAFNQLVM